MENKVTVLTECRVQDKPSRVVTRDGLHDMSQMLLDLPFPNPQHLCQLVGRQPGACDYVDDSLTRCSFGRQHESIS
jgi:hypothetical protein